MEMWSLANDDRRIILHCLRVAGDRFKEDAAICTDASQPRLAAEFERYATRAFALLAALEE